MNRVSNLQKNSKNTKKSTHENRFWKGNYRFCAIWMLIGILLGGIPLSILLAFYLKASPKSQTITPKSTPTLRWNQTGITIAGVSGNSGVTSNRLKSPGGLSIDWSNTLYIADQENNRIQKYLKGALFGETVAGNASGIPGIEYNTLRSPGDLKVDLNGDIYVADSMNHRIQLWKRGSLNGITIAGKTGTTGNSLSLLNSPRGIIRHPTSDGIFVADYYNNRTLYYQDGVLNGTVVAGGNGGGVKNNQLNYPMGMHFDIESNSLLITNSITNNVVKWRLGSSNWALLTGDANGTISSASNGLFYPTDVILDPMSNMYVVDAGNYRVQLFLAGETNGKTIAGTTGVPGNNASLFGLPYSIVLDSQLNLYVSDYLNHRVQKFIRY